MQYLSELPIAYFFDPNERLFWGYLLSAAAIAVVMTLLQGRRLPKSGAAKSYWLHRSAVVDYQYFFIIWLIKVYLLAPLLFSARDVALLTHALTREQLSPLPGVSYQTVGWLYTICLFVASDFTRYWLHRALHAFDCLWVFHKVHHSAEVLNPVTFYRVHPVESLLFGIRYALTVGVVTGIFMSLFGAKINIQQVIGVNLFLFIFSVLGSNLRHSHIYLRYPGWLERLLISPAQHQLHHQYRTARRNYGGALALWDWLFGSLKVSRRGQKPEYFGLGEADSAHFDSVAKLLLSPFNALFRQIKKSRHSKGRDVIIK